MATKNGLGRSFTPRKLHLLGPFSPPFISSRPLKNVSEAAGARRKRPKKRSLLVVNEHFEDVFNAARATQVVFQQPASSQDRK
jgi:hypothetical protein